MQACTLHVGVKQINGMYMVVSHSYSSYLFYCQLVVSLYLVVF